MKCHRSPHTTQERRMSCDDFDGYQVKIRAKRNHKNLPNAWDDLMKGYHRRTWKRYRTTQYKPVL